MVPFSLFPVPSFCGSKPADSIFVRGYRHLFLSAPNEPHSGTRLFGDAGGSRCTAAHPAHVSCCLAGPAGLVDRYGARLPLIVGTVVAGIGFLLFAVPSVGGSYWDYIFFRR